MDWRKFLRDERTRMRSRLHALSSRKSKIWITQHGQREEAIPKWMDKLRRNITKIEEILTDAGEPIDDKESPKRSEQWRRDQ